MLKLAALPLMHAHRVGKLKVLADAIPTVLPVLESQLGEIIKLDRELLDRSPLGCEPHFLRRAWPFPSNDPDLSIEDWMRFLLYALCPLDSGAPDRPLC